MAGPGSPCGCDESKALKEALRKALTELARVTESLIGCERKYAKADSERQELKTTVGHLRVAVDACVDERDSLLRELSSQGRIGAP